MTDSPATTPNVSEDTTQELIRQVLAKQTALEAEIKDLKKNKNRGLSGRKKKSRKSTKQKNGTTLYERVQEVVKRHLKAQTPGFAPQATREGDGPSMAIGRNSVATLQDIVAWVKGKVKLSDYGVTDERDSTVRTAIKRLAWTAGEGRPFYGLVSLTHGVYALGALAKDLYVSNYTQGAGKDVVLAQTTEKED